MRLPDARAELAAAVGPGASVKRARTEGEAYVVPAGCAPAEALSRLGWRIREANGRWFLTASDAMLARYEAAFDPAGAGHFARSLMKAHGWDFAPEAARLFSEGLKLRESATAAARDAYETRVRKLAAANLRTGTGGALACAALLECIIPDPKRPDRKEQNGMKLKWYGHSCFGMTFSNGVTLVTDPFDETVGYPLCTVRADAALTSHGHFDHNYVQSLAGDPAVFAEPGAYDFKGIRIVGTASFHDPERGKLRGKNTIFSVEADGLKIVHLGDLGHLPDETQFKAISNADVLLIPIGGTYTITTPQAVEVVRMAKPRCAIAMHYANDWCHFPVTDEKEFVRALGAAELPGEIEITPQTELPAAATMRYET